MKNLIFTFLFLMVCHIAPAQDYDLFLCIGQSNMAGRGYLTEATLDTIPQVYLLNDKDEFEKAVNPLNRYSTIRKDMGLQRVGPSYSFSKTIAAKTGHQVGLVVNARGGSSIASWKKGSKDGYYEEALRRIKEAMKYGKLKAIIWHQGESNSSHPELYKDQITELVANFRKDLNMPDLFFVAGEIALWGSGEQTTDKNTKFNSMIGQISQFIPNTECVSSKGLMPLIDYKDPHINADSQIILGERYAEKVLEHCYKNND